MIKTLVIAGARPNFVKVAPLMRAMDAVGGIEARAGEIQDCTGVSAPYEAPEDPKSSSTPTRAGIRWPSASQR